MVNSNLKNILVGCTVFGALLAFPAIGDDYPSKSNHGRFPLYDKFDKKRLDPKKWYGEQRATGGPGGLEILRRVNRKHQLSMRHRVSGGDQSDTGRHISRNRLLIAGDTPISGMQFDARVNHLKLSACPSPGASKAAAKSRGVLFLFNDGSSTGDNDARGDIGAVVEISRDTMSEAPRREYSVKGFLFRCESKGCGTSSIVDTVDLGTVRRREVASLGIEWQADINAVSFWKNDQELNLTYGFTPSGDPVLMNNRLEVRVEAANCTAGESFATMKTIFDNVEVKR